MSIDVKGIDKEDLLLTLYNNAKPQGMGFLHYTNTPMTREEAHKILNQECAPDSCYMDLYFTKLSLDCSYSEILKSTITKVQGDCHFTNLSFDYLKGRLIKTDISGDTINLWEYKRDNTHVDIEDVINDLKTSKTALSEVDNLEVVNDPKSSVIPYSIRPTREDEFLTYFTKKLVDLKSVINPHTKTIDLSSILAEFDLVEKCKDSSYDAGYSKATLEKYDLYPWEWNQHNDNSKMAVDSLCSLVLMLNGEQSDTALTEL